MNKNTSLPVLAKHSEEQVITPIVPLNFVYPGLSISQIISMLWAYRKTSAIIIAIILALTVVTMKILPRTYIAQATLMVNYVVNDPINGKNLPTGQLGSYIATQEQLIASPELISDVVDRLNLTTDKVLASGYSGKTGTLKQWVIEQVIKNLNVWQGQFGSQLLYVSYSAKDPNKAAKIVNAVVDVYKQQDEERTVTQPVEQKAYYAKQLSELKKNVELAQQNVTDFDRQHRLDGGVKNVDVAMLETLEQRLFQAQNQRRLIEARASGNQSASDSVLASNQVQQLQAQLDQQQAKLEKMEALYTPEYPDLQNLKIEINATKQSLATAIQQYATNDAEKLSSAKKLEHELKLAVTKQRAKVLANSKIHSEASKYLLALESAQAVYKRALDGYDELRFSPHSRYSNVYIVTHATPPLKASKPRVIKGLIMGTAFAFMLGLGIPFGYELFDRRIRCRDDLDRAHGITVLAVIGPLSKGTSI